MNDDTRMESDTRVLELAKEAYGFARKDTRADGVTSYWHFEDERPEWILDMSRAAHDNGSMFPDDWRYEFIVDALAALYDAEDGADLDELAYTLDSSSYSATSWLASHGYRPGYVDDAVEELGDPSTGVLDMIRMGMAAEQREVFGQVLAFLREYADAEELVEV
jgi:hypothetical protein